MFALINYQNQVVSLAENKFDVSNLFSWVEVPKNTVVNAGYLYQNGTFIDPCYPDLENAQIYQKRLLSNTCQNAICRGFKSSALGASNLYASGATDQRNIVQSAQSTKGGLVSLYNLTANAWERSAHTQAQAQQVLEDFVTFRDTCRTQLSTLEAQITAATTIDDIKTIVWKEVP